MRTRTSAAAAASLMLAAAAGCSAGSSVAALRPSAPAAHAETSSSPAATSAANHAAQSPTRKSAREQVTPFSNSLRTALAARPAKVSAVVERIGVPGHWALDPQLRAYSASIVKVPILLAALVHARQQGTTLSAAQRATATAMIERSDNDAATKLWRYAGGSAALRALFASLGMNSTTTAAPTLFEPWDGVQTTAGDQMVLLRALLYGVPHLAPSDLQFARELMSSVEADQRWGVPTGIPRTASVVVKNGWVPVGHKGWTVNTIGVVQNGDHTYALAVLSTGSPTEASGIATVNMVAEAVASALSRA